MKLTNALTGILALAAALPAHANLLCYDISPNSSVVLEMNSNPDQSMTATLEVDGATTKYTGTYVVNTEASDQPDGPFKVLSASMVDEAGQAAEFTASYLKIWSNSGECGRAGCVPKEVTQIIGNLSSAKITKSFFCYEAKAL